MSTWRDVDVGCPFYLSSDSGLKTGYVVRCEGLVEGSKLCHRFRKKAQLDVQMETFCCGKYENCEIYRMLDGIWQEE